MQDFPQICLVNTPCDISFEGPFQAPFIDFGHEAALAASCPHALGFTFGALEKGTNSVNY